MTRVTENTFTKNEKTITTAMNSVYFAAKNDLASAVIPLFHIIMILC